jgi:hypothetical protein
LFKVYQEVINLLADLTLNTLLLLVEAEAVMVALEAVAQVVI